MKFVCNIITKIVYIVLSLLVKSIRLLLLNKILKFLFVFPKSFLSFGFSFQFKTDNKQNVLDATGGGGEENLIGCKDMERKLTLFLFEEKLETHTKSYS